MRGRRLLLLTLAGFFICWLSTFTAYADDPDTDGDGIPDAWEIQYGLNYLDPSDALLDPDGDGASNLDEYRTDTNPVDPSSVLRLSLSSAGPNYVISWNQSPNIQVILQQANTLDDETVWVNVPAVASPYFFSPSAVSRRFYRLMAFRPGGPLVFSVNKVGFANLFMATGTNFVRVPFYTPSYAVSDLIPNAPDGTCIVKTGQLVNCFQFGLWDNPGMTLNRGEPFQYIAPFAHTIRFFGEAGGDPIVVAQPIDQSASATFIIATVGSTPLRHQWRKNGANINDGANISGATSNILAITNPQSPDSGSYAVVIANGQGGILSQRAQLTVPGITSLQAGDSFANRIQIFGTNGLISGNNVGATKENGEPNHAGKAGGKSVWYVWQAPANGIATFRTTGSQFDTLLALYQGTDVSQLAEVASDEDRGGFLTSKVLFNAAAGTDYAIAIDGFAGGEGAFILEWAMDLSGATLPVIDLHPQSQSVAAGSNATFTVSASGSGLIFQWLFNGNVLTNATNNTLVRANVQPSDVGFYTVQVSNTNGRTALSLPAALEIGPVAGILTSAKLEDLPGNSSGFGPLRAGKKAAGSEIILAQAGTLQSQIFSTVDSTNQPAPSNPCGIIGSSARWFKVRAGTNGTMVMDTRGSSFDTALMVFTGSNLLSFASVICNDNASTDVTWSRVSFSATNGMDYSVVVDGPGQTSGTVQYNWGLGSEPKNTGTVSNAVVKAGSNLVLQASISGTPPPVYYWYRNGAFFVPTVTNRLELSTTDSASAGLWSVVASNFVGQTSNVVANVRVATGFRLNATRMLAGGVWQAKLSGTNQQMIIEANTNLSNQSGWVPVHTNSLNTPLNFLDSQSGNLPRRFYRAVPTR